MKLLVNNHRELIEAAESYFRSTPERCIDHDGRCCYAKPGSGSRCVIGDVLHVETDFDLHWLRNFRGTAEGVLAGWFGVHPYTKLAEVARQLQIIHDDPDNWIQGAGFTGWGRFFELKERYK